MELFVVTVVAGMASVVSVLDHVCVSVHRKEGQYLILKLCPVCACIHCSRQCLSSVPACKLSTTDATLPVKLVGLPVVVQLKTKTQWLL